MKTASRITLTLAAVTTLAAIWQPFGGTWWQWAITALVLFLAGAGTGAASDKPRHPIDEPELLPEHVARELVPNSTLEKITPDDVTDYKRREYGRKADQ